jgi:hypothetical protein
LSAIQPERFQFFWSIFWGTDASLFLVVLRLEKSVIAGDIYPRPAKGRDGEIGGPNSHGSHRSNPRG